MDARALGVGEAEAAIPFLQFGEQHAQALDGPVENALPFLAPQDGAEVRNGTVGRCALGGENAEAPTPGFHVVLQAHPEPGVRDDEDVEVALDRLTASHSLDLGEQLITTDERLERQRAPVRKEIRVHVRAQEQCLPQVVRDLKPLVQEVGAEVDAVVATHQTEEHVADLGFPGAGLAVDDQDELEQVVPEQVHARDHLQRADILQWQAACEEFLLEPRATRLREVGDRRGVAGKEVGAEGLHLPVVTLAIEPRNRPLRIRLLYHFGPRAGINSILASVPKLGRFPVFSSPSTTAVAPAPKPLAVRGQLGPESEAYTIDTIPVPYDNPDKALIFCSGIGFFDDGDAAVSTLHGDVWRVSGLDAGLEQVTWRRVATGLYQPLGLTMVRNQPVVLCRDHLVRLHDRNGDGVTDHYESLSSLIDTSGSGHDYVTSLCQDNAGNFYYVDPKGAHRISPDGQHKKTLADGFRNPNGMGVSPDGSIILVAPQQGSWTPSSVLHEIRQDGWYGHGGPRPTPSRPLGYDLPLCWIPHRIDNSSGSQAWAPSDRFGPLSGQILHLSWGRCTMLLTLRDVVDGTPQGAVLPLKGRFLSGPMRAAFRPQDGQMYVVGCQGWQTAAARDGSFQRVRWTGKPLALPTAWKALPGQLTLTFNEPLDPATAQDSDSYALEAWNYRYSGDYGSKDWSVRNPTQEGRDPWAIQKASLSKDGRTVALDIADLKPVMQFGLRFNLDTANGRPASGELYGTIHKLHARRASP